MLLRANYAFQEVPSYEPTLANGSRYWITTPDLSLYLLHNLKGQHNHTYQIFVIPTNFNTGISSKIVLLLFKTLNYNVVYGANDPIRVKAPNRGKKKL
jgi:hypothetical protein